MSELCLLLVDMTTHGPDTAFADSLAQHFTVHVVRHPVAGMQRARELDPDVFCLEYDFPDTAGLDLLSEVKALAPSVPIVMATTQTSEELAVWALRSSVWDYLVKPASDEEVAALASRVAELRRRRAGNRAARESARPGIARPDETSMRGNTPVARSVFPAVSFVERNLHKRVSEKLVAKLCKMSPFRFSRAFKEVHGLTFREYVMRRRIREAVRLLQSPHASVSEVCYRVGFNDPSYFSRIFKRYLGTSPSTFRGDPHDAQIAISGVYAQLDPG